MYQLLHPTCATTHCVLYQGILLRSSTVSITSDRPANPGAPVWGTHLPIFPVIWSYIWITTILARDFIYSKITTEVPPVGNKSSITNEGICCTHRAVSSIAQNSGLKDFSVSGDSAHHFKGLSLCCSDDKYNVTS
ncbi:uncharacterized protein LOC130050842 isoform X2 [Ostrea edulis]|uniref:uncharacterized protein LOC130050842 isoform X2 n=1 Tax=Ostrea edulis TaxID=37623 RepID=UPI0024AF0D12|nr:uncharacterized protein LOC130050842 isoform X2 [Ostrea edulis]